MTGTELRAIRHKLGLSVRELGYAIGYRGQPDSVAVAIRLFEGGQRPIPPWIARLAWLLGERGAVPDEWIG